MRERMLRRRLAAAAALAAAVLAMLVPGAGTTAAPEPTIASLRIELLAAIAEEKRALELLAKEPPRDRAAELQLDSSIERLRHIEKALQGLSLPAYVRDSIRSAAGLDGIATARLPPLNQAIREIAITEIERALNDKHQVLGALIAAPRAGASQCADGRDNDGDRLVDARYESGCTNAKDASEGSPLTCTLGVGVAGGRDQVKGSCSGTFAKIELDAPRGATFDTKLMPVAPQAELCRYSSPSRLECTMDDGAANPRHLVDLRFKLRNGPAARLRALIRDFAGRARTFTVAPQAGRVTADLAVTARVDTAFLDQNGRGRVSGTLEVTNRGPNESSPFTLLISANRMESARAAEVTSLSLKCTQTASGVTCTGPRVAKDLALGFAFALPVTGAGLLIVDFEVRSDSPDPQPANNKTSVQVELRSQR